MMKTAILAGVISLISAGAALADADATAGAVVFKKCAACHTASEAKNKVGPSLMGVVGRKVATVDGFKYSDAMREFGADGKIWDEARLAVYLANPKGLVAKTKMAFPGLKKPEDIASVIAYLKDQAMAK